MRTSARWASRRAGHAHVEFCGGGAGDRTGSICTAMNRISREGAPRLCSGAIDQRAFLHQVSQPKRRNERTWQRLLRGKTLNPPVSAACSHDFHRALRPGFEKGGAAAFGQQARLIAAARGGVHRR